MTTSIRARYTNGALVPLEPLDLEEGAVVSVSVEETPEEIEGPLLRILRKVRKRQAELPPDAWDGLPTNKVSAEEQAQSGLTAESMREMFDRIWESAPPDAFDNLPTDLAKNKKHYLYGHPKEED